MPRRPYKLRSRQTGLAAPEMVLITPFLILIFIAMWEVGWAINQYDTLTKYVRDAGRYLSYSAYEGSTQIISLTQTMMESGQTLTQDVQNLVVYGTTVPDTSGNPATQDQPILPGLTTDNIALSVVSEDGLVSARHARIVASYTYTPVILDTLSLGFGSDLNFGVTMQASVTVRAL